MIHLTSWPCKRHPDIWRPLSWVLWLLHSPMKNCSLVIYFLGALISRHLAVLLCLPKVEFPQMNAFFQEQFDLAQSRIPGCVCGGRYVMGMHVLLIVYWTYTKMFMINTKDTKNDNKMNVHITSTGLPYLRNPLCTPSWSLPFLPHRSNHFSEFCAYFSHPFFLVLHTKQV